MKQLRKAKTARELNLANIKKVGPGEEYLALVSAGYKDETRIQIGAKSLDSFFHSDHSVPSPKKMRIKVNYKMIVGTKVSPIKENVGHAIL